MGKDSDEWTKQLKVGKMGEAVVLDKLAKRRHWNSPKAPALKGATTISTEHIMCQAQKCTDRSEEHQPNKDFTVSVNACKKCKFIDCQYREYEPYPKRVVGRRHEIKTNEATHRNPSGNIFIEYLSNVTKDNPNKPGWFKCEPLASWYHFYQPVHPKEPDISDDEKERFRREMTTTDRLIPNKEFGYIISITGKKLKEIEPILCQKVNGKPKIIDVPNQNEKKSKGTIIPVTEILNNPLCFNKNQSDILFTPEISMVSGTQASTESGITYYLPKSHYDSLQQIGDIKPDEYWTSGNRLELKSAKFLQTINDNLVWFGKFEFLLPNGNDTYTEIEVNEGWAIHDIYGNIEVIGGDATVNGIKNPLYVSFKLDKSAVFFVETTGKKILPISPQFIKSYYRKFDGARLSAPIYESINTKPYVAILKNAKSWG